MQGYQPGYPQPPGPMVPMGPSGGISRLKIVGLIVGVLAISVLAMAGNYARTRFLGSGKPFTAGYGQLGIPDPSHADGDVMMTAVGPIAKRWKWDAVWWGLTYTYVGPDGTMDLSKGSAVVEYASLSSAKSYAKSVNQDAIKQFRFGATDVSFNQTTGVRDVKSWQNAVPLAMPTCGIKQLAKKLAAEKGLSAGKTVRVMYDQQFAFAAPQEQSWHVTGDDPKIDAYYSMATCNETHRQ